MKYITFPTLALFIFGVFILAMFSSIVSNMDDVPLSTTVFISDRLEACEAKGGKYHLNWSEFDGGYYYEWCEIVDDEIEDF